MSSDKLSELNNKSLDEYFDYLNKQQLYYRDSLSLQEFVTFGIEIEYEKFKREKADNYTIRTLKKWHSKDDSTLKVGGEVTSPILTDSLTAWKELRKICNYLRKNKVYTKGNAGGHIHVGSHIMNADLEAWRCFLKTYMIYENELVYFLNGEDKLARKSASEYVKLVSETYYKRLDDINEARDLSELYYAIILSKKNALSFFYTKLKSTHRDAYNTVEFRSPNSSVNELIWQNNINTVTKLMLAARNKRIDEDFLDYKLEKEPDKFTLLPKALELADIIFDNDLDKMYFLKQYKKDFSFIEEKKEKTKVMSFK